MTEMSRRFNFDDFDELCREALDERMAQEGVDLEEEQAWADHDRVFYPGEIGGVVTHLTFNAATDSDFDSLPEPPEAA